MLGLSRSDYHAGTNLRAGRGALRAPRKNADDSTLRKGFRTKLFVREPSRTSRDHHVTTTWLSRDHHVTYHVTSHVTRCTSQSEPKKMSRDAARANQSSLHRLVQKEAWKPPTILLGVDRLHDTSALSPASLSCDVMSLSQLTCVTWHKKWRHYLQQFMDFWGSRCPLHTTFGLYQKLSDLAHQSRNNRVRRQ